MIYESPSGTPDLQATTVDIDWGTVNPGDTVGFILTPFNEVGEDVKRPFWPCPISPMPAGSNTFCVPANFAGIPAALVIVGNNTGGPLVIGVKRYALLYGDLSALV